MKPFPGQDAADRATDFPELRACKSVRASVIRQLLRDRNTLDRKLEALACPQTATHHLSVWLDGVVRDLPDPGGLAEALFEPGLDPAVFEAMWETLESSHGVLGRMPKPASDYLEAVAQQENQHNAEALTLFYWAGLHHPLRDQLDLLRRSVTELVTSGPLTRRVQAALMRCNAGASPGAARAAAVPADLQRALDEEKRTLSSLSGAIDSELDRHFERSDPISQLLSSVHVQPVGGSGVFPGSHRREALRRLATRTYAIRYVQQHLSLPVDRHAISRHGQPGDDFWVDFGGSQAGNLPTDNKPFRP